MTEGQDCDTEVNDNLEAQAIRWLATNGGKPSPDYLARALRAWVGQD